MNRYVYVFLVLVCGLILCSCGSLQKKKDDYAARRGSFDRERRLMNLDSEICSSRCELNRTLEQALARLNNSDNLKQRLDSLRQKVTSLKEKLDSLRQADREVKNDYARLQNSYQTSYQEHRKRIRSLEEKLSRQQSTAVSTSVIFEDLPDGLRVPEGVLQVKMTILSRVESSGETRVWVKSLEPNKEFRLMELYHCESGNGNTKHILPQDEPSGWKIFRLPDNWKEEGYQFCNFFVGKVGDSRNYWLLIYPRLVRNKIISLQKGMRIGKDGNAGDCFRIDPDLPAVIIED